MSTFAAKWNRTAIPVIVLALCCCLCPAAAQAAETPQAADTPAAACNLTTQAKKSLATLKANGKLKVALAKSKTYTGKAIKPKPTLKLNGKKLVRGRDFAVVYKNAKGKVVTPKAVGTYKVIIKGKGSYKGTIARTFKVLKKQITVKTNAFTLKLPRYWTGRVKVGKVSARTTSEGYRSYSLEIEAKKGGEVLGFFWNPRNASTRDGRFGLIGDLPAIAEKSLLGKKYGIYIGTISWALNGSFEGAFGLSKKQASNLIKILTGGQSSKVPSRYSEKLTKRIDSYLEKNILNKIKGYTKVALI